jgi:hypothetical protein
MTDMNSLTGQLEKLNIVYDETISKGASLADIKKVYYQIREVENMIAGKTKQAGSGILFVY